MIAPASIAFSGLSVVVPDGGTRTLTLRLSLKSTAGVLIDNSRFQFSVTSANISVTGNGVLTAAVNSDQTRNQIAVVATKLVFSSVPASVVYGQNFAATVQAQDANNNAGSGFDCGGDRQQGRRQRQPHRRQRAKFVGRYPDLVSLQMDTAGTFTLQATAAGLTSATSGNLTATVPNATAILFTATAPARHGDPPATGLVVRFRPARKSPSSA